MIVLLLWCLLVIGNDCLDHYLVKFDLFVMGYIGNKLVGFV